MSDVALGKYQQTPPTLEDGETAPLPLDVDGKLITTGGGGGGGDVTIVAPLGEQPKADSVAIAIGTDQLPLHVKLYAEDSHGPQPLLVDSNKNLMVDIASQDRVINVDLETVGSAAIALGPTLAAGGVPIAFPTDQAVFVKNTDAGGVNVAAVKAASTAPLATDPALVVAISPNSPAAPVAGHVYLTDSTVTNAAAVKAASTAPLATDPALVVSLSPNSASVASHITDAGGTTTAAVKAASTAPVATDPALVVAISPNSPAAFVIPHDTNATGTILANGQSVTVSVNGAGMAYFNITGAWTGTLQLECQAGDGSWQIIGPMSASGPFFVSGGITANGQFIIACGGMQQLRLTATSGITGTGAVVTINCGNGGPQYINQGNGIGTNSAGWLFGMVDTLNGTGPVAVKNSSVKATAADISAVMQLSPNSMIQTNKAMVPGAQFGLPVIFESQGMGLTQRVDETGHSRPGNDSLLFHDSIEGTTLSPQWIQTSSGMALTVSGGLLTLNSGSVLTTGTWITITSRKQFPLYAAGGTTVRFRQQVAIGAANAIYECGFGLTAANATATYGIYFQLNGAVIKVVTCFNGAETTTNGLALTTGHSYTFTVYQDEDLMRFVVQDSSGVSVFSTSVSPPNTLQFPANVSHLPLFLRVRNSAAVASTMKPALADVEVWGLDIDRQRPWAVQQAGVGHGSNVLPTTFAQTLQLAANADPAAITPAANASTAYNTLGGEWIMSVPNAGTAVLALFAWTNPTLFTMVVTDIMIPLPVVTSALGATAFLHELIIQVGTTTDPSSDTGPRYPIALQGAAASAPANTFLSGNEVKLNLATPLVVPAGQTLMLLTKVLTGVAGGTLRGFAWFNGYWE